MKQMKIIDFFAPRYAEDDARDAFYAQYDEFQPVTHVDKPLPTVENVRKRFGRDEANRYRTTLAEAEDAGITYEISTKQNLNSKTCAARVRALGEALQTISF